MSAAKLKKAIFKYNFDTNESLGVCCVQPASNSVRASYFVVDQDDWLFLQKVIAEQMYFGELGDELGSCDIQVTTDKEVIRNFVENGDKGVLQLELIREQFIIDQAEKNGVDPDEIHTTEIDLKKYIKQNFLIS